MVYTHDFIHLVSVFRNVVRPFLKREASRSLRLAVMADPDEIIRVKSTFGYRFNKYLF